jgi:putative peptidoglycan lipid II flippase
VNSPRDKKPSLLRASGATAIATLASRILGLARDAVLAAFLPKELTDIFWAAFRIPNTFRRLFGEGAVSVAFLPVFTQIRKEAGTEAARALLGRVLGIILLATGAVTLLGSFFAPTIVRWLLEFPADGSAAELESLAQVLVRWMFPYLIFICLAAVVMGTLNATGRFFVPALTPIYFNGAIIVGAWLADSRDPVDLRFLAASVLAGGILQLLSQGPSLAASGFWPRWRGASDSTRGGVSRILKLFLPASLGLGVQQVNVLVNTYFASTLGAGAISYLYYADRMAQFPLGVLGFAVATAAFPRFSQKALDTDREAIRKPLLQSLSALVLVMLPSTVGLWILGGPILDLIFNRGEFAAQGSLEQTLPALRVYCLGLVPFSCVKLMGNLSFALGDGRTPVIAGISAALTNLALAWWLKQTPLAHSGIALAVVVAATVNLALITLRLRHTLRGAWLIEESPVLAKIVAASSAMGIALVLWTNLSAGWGSLTEVLGGMAVGGGTYFAVAFLLLPDLVKRLILRRRAKQ